MSHNRERGKGPEATGVVREKVSTSCGRRRVECDGWVLPLVLFLVVTGGFLGYYFGIHLPRAQERLLDSARGGIALDTKPGGAVVQIGDLPPVQVPAMVSDLRLGEYPVVITHPDCRVWEGTAVVTEGRYTHLGTIHLERSTGSIAVALEPPDARWVLVKADGETEPLSGQGDVRKGDLPTGEYHLYVNAFGWQPWSERLWVAAEEEKSVRVALDDLRGENTSVEVSAGAELELIWIQPGEFLMGSPSDQAGHTDREGPQTLMQLTEGYWVGKFPVTVGQFRAFVEATGYRTDAERERSRGTLIYRGGRWRDTPDRHWQNIFADDEMNPVVAVSWNDAMAFCRFLSDRERNAGRLPEGFIYTLPSEVQWEYAARAGSTTRWSFGDDEALLGEYAWYRRNSEGRTHPVGGKKPNAWGLYDVHGNVWEWTRTLWQENLPGGTVKNCEGPPSGHFRSNRGGSWNDVANFTHSALRGRCTEGYRDDNVGFRLALSPAP